MRHGAATRGPLGRGVLAIGITLLLLVATACGTRAEDTSFHFTVTEGLNLNYFLRDGDSAAHLLLRSGRNPRVVTAFPAGNSGAGLWFEPLAADADWQLEAPPVAKTATDARGRALHGIDFEASIPVPALTVRQAVLSNVRVLRDYDQKATVPAEVLAPPTISNKTMSWARDRLDGAPGYRLDLEVTSGAVTDRTISAGADGRIKLRVTALTGDTPLTPLSGSSLLNGAERANDSARNTLTFLSYQEKFLAGSWRFNTYFGRDTLLSLRLLMPVLAPDATEAGLRSVLARLAADGTVAHEEALSEFAILTRRLQGETPDAAPILDYSMIDESYLLAPVAAAYLLDDPEGAARAPTYLRTGIADNDTAASGQALVRNLRLVASSATAFARDPVYTNLIGLRAGRDAGEWRDSERGLGGGRYPYNVNAILVPTALEAIARLVDSKVLDSFLSHEDRMELSFAAANAKVWRAEAPPLFTVTRDAAQAEAALGSYAESLGVPAQDAVAALGRSPVSFSAVALDAAGRPIPIVHSDDAFDLLFGAPAPERLDRQVSTLIRPFPLGLMTQAGLVVANPVFADPALQAQFTTHDYHGTVVWSWVQAAFASGLERQLGRSDLPAPVRDRLTAAQRTLWQAIEAAATMQNSELWSWRFENGSYRVTPFGAHDADITESNAAQLWSSVYLAVKPPS